jgi:assimilatory nitrate reductase catalytic subunit
MSRTGTVARLFNLDDEPLLSMHPADLRQRGLVSGDVAHVGNARGQLHVRVKPTPACCADAPGCRCTGAASS